MSFRPPQPISGHVERREGKRRPVWHAKYRLPDGEKANRPGVDDTRTAGRRVLHAAHGVVRTGATFADAVAEYMRWLEQDRARKPTTLRGYESIMRAHLLPAFGRRRLEDLSADEVEAWSAALAASGTATSTRLRILTCLFGVMKRAKRVWNLPRNRIAVENRTGWFSTSPPLRDCEVGGSAGRGVRRRIRGGVR
jgi:hypothetical protein